MEAATATSPLARSRKHKVGVELLCEHVFRPLAHVVVLALLPLRVAPPAVVLANAACALAGAVAIARGNLIAAALLLQAKTVLDNADGQLARLSGRVTAFGRYLDSECDLLTNAVICAALGYATGNPWLALAAYCALTIVLSVNFNLERLYKRERGEIAEAMPPAQGAAALLAALYRAVYDWQDRLIERVAERRLRGRSQEARLAYHDRGTLAIVANFGLSTQLAVLGACLALGHPAAYLWLVLAQAAALVPLELRRAARSRA